METFKNNKGKKIVVLSEYEALFGSYNKLKHVLGVTKEDKEREEIMCWCDCDHIKTHGEEGRGDTDFNTIDIGNVRYIITMFEIEDIEMEVLKWWQNSFENEIEIDNNWDEWNKVEKGIAYRGGSGYCYALYAMELSSNN